MPSRHFRHFVRGLFPVLIFLLSIALAPAQEKNKKESSVAHAKERAAWFLRGRIVGGKPSAELRRRAYQEKMRPRGQHAATVNGDAQTPSIGSWTPLGPVPLASDASGTGLQDYHQVTGRATAVAIDPADSSGNTVYIGGAQGGIWKSTNAASSDTSAVTWAPIADDQATLSIGSIAIQPGNVNPAKTLILAATGEANNSSDSYFGLGILRSADAGQTWTLVPSANNGALSFSGLGGTRMAFSTATTVVSAMATSTEGVNDGAATAGTIPGLYTSLDAGQSWTYNALLDPGNQPTDATSATSVVYNATNGIYFAAVRYHGFYSSPNGTAWTRLATQPGGTLLNATACPPVSTSNNRACPLFRAEITVVPGRNEMYAWFISLDSEGNPVDEGIWQSTDGAVTWKAVSNSGITNCGDLSGCGVEQGNYNLELLALPNASGTDLYAGAINLYKCSINASNPLCGNSGFINLTHTFGCDPIAAPAHVHPNQHALAFTRPAGGAASGGALLYFANDGGIYRALDGYSGLISGSCSGTNAFDDLNQNLGSMIQFVSLSQHPTDANKLLGGAQDNGFPASMSATTNPSWISVNGGDGGFTAIDPNSPASWFVSNPDIPPGGLNVQQCSSGVTCREGDFTAVVTSSQVGGDDAGFYAPYILDPQSQDALLVGTCRVWRGSRLGGAYTVLSPNFDTFGSGTCIGSESNTVRALAAGGPIDGNGSKVIYAGTDGPGPSTITSPAGGHIWVTSNASTGASSFADVTGNINPNHFPISSVAVDALDSTGNTAYVAIMGFTGTSGHVWKTINGGVAWTDFNGVIAHLPDSPVNALLVDASTNTIYAGTDVGVFASSTASSSWSELGPLPGNGQAGFLPNVAVTGLAIFSSANERLLRASTYGRGIWQFNLNPVADFQITIPNPDQTVFLGQVPTFSGTATAVNGYSNSISLLCVPGATNPPDSCLFSPSVLTPAANTPFTITASGALGDFSFNAQADGSDAQNTTHRILLSLHIVDFGMTAPAPISVTVPRGTTSSPVSFQITAAGPFNQSVNIACTVGIPGAICNLTPGPTVSPTSAVPVSMTASIVVPVATTPAAYTVNLQATTAGAPAPLATSFSLNVTTNPDFILTGPATFPLVRAGSTNTNAQIGVTGQDGFASAVALTCAINSANGSCGFNPTSVNTYPASAEVVVSATSLPAGSYQISVQGTSGAITHTLAIPFNVGDYQLSGTQALSLAPGAQGTANLTITPSSFYTGSINVACDRSALASSQCVLSPPGPLVVNSATPLALIATINVPTTTAPGVYPIRINTSDTTGNPAHNLTVQVTISGDYTISAPTPPSQSIKAGQSATYNFSVAPIGASFDKSITLNCIIAPVFLGKCTLNPNPLPPFPNATAVSVVMTVTTQASTTSLIVPGENGLRAIYACWFTLPGLLLCCSRRRSRLTLAFALAFLLFLPSCGGGSNGGGGGGGGNNGTTPGTYTITVVGTPASVSQPVPPNVTLTVN